LTILDFCSYCGGSLGLFLGFSVISAIEIVYYFTLRILYKRKLENRIENFNQNSKDKPNYLQEFAGLSSVHGFNQTAFKRRHASERYKIVNNFSNNNLTRAAFIISTLYEKPLYFQILHTKMAMEKIMAL
jgi:hypothetical protein